MKTSIKDAEVIILYQEEEYTMITNRESTRPNYVAEIMETLSGRVKSTNPEKEL